MTGGPGERRSRDLQDVDALVLDRYLDTILAAHARGADNAPIPAGDVPSWDIRFAVSRLTRDLPRFHPSFRFEEALAAKLAEAAARMRLPLAAGAEGRGPAIAPLPTAPLYAVDDEGLLPDDTRAPIARELLIGGALTSAALSIAGAAYVAWRIRHPQSSPMARAVRRVARTRLA